MLFSKARWAYGYLMKRLDESRRTCPRCNGTGRARLKRGQRYTYAECRDCGGLPTLPEI